MEKEKLILKSLAVSALPRKVEDGYETFVYTVEKWGKEKDDTLISSFSKSKKEDDDDTVVVRDKDLVMLSATDKANNGVFSALYSGIDALHSSVVAESQDFILSKIKSTTKATAAKAVFTEREKYKKKILEKSCSGIGHLTEKQELALMKEIKRMNALFSGSLSSDSATSVDIDLIERYAFRKNIMFLGPAGVGKTYMLTEWADSRVAEDGYKYYHIDGHEGYEISDMLGMMVPNETSGMSWIDGPLTQAFRDASRGHKTIIMIDEILRIPDKERSILIGSLIPKADGMLSLRTNRIKSYDEDGVGQTEEIKCLPENLWVVAASNIGVGYSVEDMDTAFQDRFRAFRVDGGEKLANLISTKICKEKGFSSNVTKAIVELFNNFNEIKLKGKFQKNFSPRHISEVLTLADTEQEIGLYLQDLTYTCLSINSSGVVNGSELEIWESLIEPFTAEV